MDYEHVIVTFTTESKQLADTMAAEVAATEFSCCSYIEGPITRTHRWHGHKHANEQWRVEIEAAPDCADALVDHLISRYGDEVRNLVVNDHVTHLV